MRRNSVLLGIMAVGVAACGGGPKTEQATPPPLRAGFYSVQATQVANVVELYGTVEAERTAALSSRVMATVTAVPVKAGDRVRKGQVLVEIDPATARGQEAQARGALAQANAALILAEHNFDRFKALAAKEAASQLELDVARMQFEQAKGAVTQGEGAVEAAVSVARESRVVAPFDGWVAEKLVEVGDLASPGRPLVRIESATGRRLVVAVPESVLEASGLHVGAAVPVRIDALGSAPPVPGTVGEISPGADPTSHTFAVKVEIPSAVAAGAAGRAALTLGTRTAMVVPRGAVLTTGGLSLVVVRDAQGRSQSRAVTLGASLDGDRVEVLSGVAAGDQIAVGLTWVPADGTPLENRS